MCTPSCEWNQVHCNVTFWDKYLASTINQRLADFDTSWALTHCEEQQALCHDQDQPDLSSTVICFKVQIASSRQSKL